MPININNFTNKILENITFSLEMGEDLIILGSNGVGKTTLAKVLCGISPSKAIDIDGLNPSSVYAKVRARLINYIPPKLDVFDAFISVREFLELSQVLAVVGKERLSGVDEVLNKLSIMHLARHSCQTLSSGESQLLLIASALLHNANYTIFDEPTANLDPQKMKLLFKILKDKNTLKSKIIITHNLDLAYKLGYDILFLADKKVQFHGASSSFFEQSNLDTLYEGAVVKEAGNILVKL